MCVITEKKPCNQTLLGYVVMVFTIGGILIGRDRPPGPPGYAYGWEGGCGAI